MGAGYITYSDNESWRGYFVRVPGTPAKLFSIGSVGDSCAHARARLYRDEMLSRIGRNGPLHYRARFSRNTSGMVGVQRVRYINRQRYGHMMYEYPRDVWVAKWWRADGTQKQRSFSVNKYGSREAKRLAIEARQKGIGKI